MPSPLPQYLSPLTIPASWVYRCAITARNRHYDRGNGVRRLDVPVISVGNITTGGVGKTPMVAWIAQLLLKNNHRPAICMRGYGATRTQRSDEQMEYEAILPNVPVIANPDRATAAAAFLQKHSEIDCLLLDDGFQHRQLHRDLDLVLIDATRDTLRDRLLPAGHLREPLENLQRADAVIVTHADAVNEQFAQEIASYHGGEPAAWTRHAWTSLRRIDATGEHAEPPAWLQEKRVVTMLGIGNPQAMRDQIIAAGAEVAADVPVRDHQRYDPPTLAAVHDKAAKADAVLVTGKDWVKLRGVLNLHDWPVPMIVPELAIEVIEGRDALEAMILGAVEAR
jgi:tetraacyldisaccharide 4'-kinase